MKTKLLQRLAAGAAALAILCAAALPARAAYDVPITLSAEGESVYLINADTGEVLLDENSAEQRYVASTTKMVTGLLLLESGVDLNTTITIPDRLTQEFRDIQAANGTDMRLKIGEDVRLIDLLYGLLVASANDAASVIADYLGGGDTAAFVSRMNDRARELGCTATNFTCPHGLYDPGNVSTAADLARIAAACMQNGQFMEIVNTLHYTVPADNVNTTERELTSTNPMLDPESPYYRADVSGIKTGFTTLAGRCFVTSAEKEGHTYILVILGAKKEGKNEPFYIYNEASALLDWTFARYSDRTLLDTGTAVARVPLQGCDEAAEATLYAAEKVVQYAYADAVVTTEVSVPEEIRAPVKAGNVIGSVTVRLDGQTVAVVDLVAGQDYASALLKGSLNVLALLPALLAVLAALTLLTVRLGRRRAPARRG